MITFLPLLLQFHQVLYGGHKIREKSFIVYGLIKYFTMLQNLFKL